MAMRKGIWTVTFRDGILYIESERPINGEPAMSAAIPPELEEFVDEELAKGRYRTRDEVISDGLRLLRERKLYELRRDMRPVWSRSSVVS